MKSPSRLAGAAGLLFATSTWGSLFVVGKPVLAHVHPLWYTLLRYTIAALAFAMLLFARGGATAWQPLRVHGARLALLGTVGYGVFSVLVLVGLSHSLPSHGAVVMATMPITTQLVRWAVDGIRPTRAVLFGTALALGGVLMVSGALFADADAGPSTLAGDLTALVGTLGWNAYTRGAARLPALDPLRYSALTALASWPLLAAATLVAAAFDFVPTPDAAALAPTWLAIVYTGLVPTVLAVIAYNAGVRTLGIVGGTAFLNFVPVSAMLIGAALGRPPLAHELIGVAMVVAALLLHTLVASRAALPARTAPAVRPRVPVPQPLD